MTHKYARNISRPLSKNTHVLCGLPERYVTSTKWLMSVMAGRTLQLGTLKQPHTQWELKGTKLTETDSVTYLGVTLSYVKPNIHVDNRISACRRA